MASTQFNLTNFYVCPTAADVAPSTHPQFGRALMENTFGALLTNICGKGGWVVDGFALPNVGASINSITISGTAVVSGYLVKSATTNTYNLYASTTNYVYLQLVRTTWGSDQLVSQAVITVSNAVIDADDQTLLAIIVTGTSTISSVTDRRQFHSGFFAGSYVGDGTNGRTISVPAIDTRKPTVYGVFDPDGSPAKLVLIWRYEGAHFAYIQNSATFTAGFDSTTVPEPATGGFSVDSDDNWNSNGREYRYLVLA